MFNAKLISFGSQQITVSLSNEYVYHTIVDMLNWVSKLRSLPFICCPAVSVDVGQ